MAGTKYRLRVGPGPGRHTGRHDGRRERVPDPPAHPNTIDLRVDRLGSAQFHGRDQNEVLASGVAWLREHTGLYVTDLAWRCDFVPSDAERKHPDDVMPIFTLTVYFDEVDRPISDQPEPSAYRQITEDQLQVARVTRRPSPR